MKAKDFDARFDTGENMTKHLDLDRAKRRRQEINMNVPEGLIEEAMKTSGSKSKTGTINEILRRKKIEKIQGLRGQVNLNLNVSASRRR